MNLNELFPQNKKTEPNMPKPKRTSTAGKKLRESAKGLSEAQDHKQRGNYPYGDALEKISKRQIKEISKSIAIEECRALGAPARNVGIPGERDKFETRLVDTMDSPNAITAHAHAERLRMLEKAGCLELAVDVTETIRPENNIERMIGHQMAASHTHAMRFLEKAEAYRDMGNPYSDDDYSMKVKMSEAAVQCANAAVRLMTVFQSGVLTLAKMRSGGQQVTVVHQHVQVAGGSVAVVGQITNKEGVDDRGADKNTGGQAHAKQIENQPATYAPIPAMPCTDTEKDSVPVTGDAEWQVPHARRNVHRRTEGK